MKRSRFSNRSRLSRDAEELTWLAAALAESASRPEDAAWEKLLDQRVVDCLTEGDDATLNQALDWLYDRNLEAYDGLADVVEACATQTTVDIQKKPHHLVMFLVPVLAWSRYRVPDSTLSASTLDALRAQLHGHVFAGETRVVLADRLLSPDQMPRNYVETWQFTQKFKDLATRSRDWNMDSATLAATQTFLADPRYILGAVLVPQGMPLYRWQEAAGDPQAKNAALTGWRQQGGGVVLPLLPGCGVELQRPDAFYSAWRQSDKSARPFSMRAAVDFLSLSLDVPAAGLRAIVAPFHDKELEEYRIGFTRKESDQVVYGVVWPLLGSENDQSGLVNDIESVLKDSGLTDILQLDTAFPLEYCDDCGSPLYPDPNGIPVHAEMPEEEGPTQAHLH